MLLYHLHPIVEFVVHIGRSAFPPLSMLPKWRTYDTYLVCFDNLRQYIPLSPAVPLAKERINVKSIYLPRWINLPLAHPPLATTDNATKSSHWTIAPN